MLPNAFSALRIALVPVLLISLQHDKENSDQLGLSFLTVILLVTIVATDILDGYCARKLGIVSRSGKILDPLADKIAICALGLGIVAWFGFPLWLLLLQFLRDMIILVSGTIVFKSRKLVMSASPLGKAATLTMMLSLSCYAFELPYDLLTQAIVISATALLILSSIDYTRRLIKLNPTNSTNERNG